MPPPHNSFPAHQLEEEIQTTSLGRRRKPAVVLEKCALKELLQYSCKVEGGTRSGGGGGGGTGAGVGGVKGGEEAGGVEGAEGAPIVCRPVVRLFRR